MPWVRYGDSTATHPVVLAGAVVTGADARTRCELLGFVTLLSTMSAGHLTDYVVDKGTVVQAAGITEADRLVKQAIEAGYLTETTIDDRPAWRIIADPEFIHLRLREEVEWERRRKRENGRTDHTLAVVSRDGSACRYCGAVVSWTDKRGGRGATYDHIAPGGIVRSPEDLVVACRSCNSSRGAAYRAGRLAEWDRATPRLPPPPDPYYCDHVRSRLTRAGITPGHSPGVTADAPERTHPGSPDQAVPAGGASPASTVTRPSWRDHDREEDPGQPDPGSPDQVVPARTDHPPPIIEHALTWPTWPKGSQVNSSGSGPAGSGRAGPGRAGSGGQRTRRRRRR